MVVSDEDSVSDMLNSQSFHAVKAKVLPFPLWPLIPLSHSLSISFNLPYVSQSICLSLSSSISYLSISLFPHLICHVSISRPISLISQSLCFISFSSNFSLVTSHLTALSYLLIPVLVTQACNRIPGPTRIRSIGNQSSL